MRPGRIVALVIGCLLIIPSIALLLGGGALALGYAVGRDDDGFFETDIDPVVTDTVAVTAENISLSAEPGSPDWIIDALDADIRLRVSSVANTDVFVGIADEADVDRYLSGVAHAEVTGLDNDRSPTYRQYDGVDQIEPPMEQDFWTTAVSGPGTQELVWEATAGRWSVVVMNGDGSPGVAADVNVGARAGFVLPLALILLGIGVVLTVSSIVLIVAGATGSASKPVTDGAAAAPPYPAAARVRATDRSPVVLEATLDPSLSRWRWLVKWFLAIPHFIVLVALWIAFMVLTLVAGVMIVITARYPRGIFDFNVGVLRWTWRVSHYATTGGIGTDRYPPFSLRAEADDRARLEIEYPERLSRGLVFVKWILVIPHFVIVALFTSSPVLWTSASGDEFGDRGAWGGSGLLGFLVLVAGCALLFADRYPPALFDLIVGFNRWIYRVIAYGALMTDRYPPFRLDQGEAEPDVDESEPDPSPPAPSARPAGTLPPPVAPTA
jgi:hypothetical protein